MDRTYAQKLAMGSSMGNPLGVATVYSGHNMYGPRITGGYVAKSRLKGSSAASVRSKSMRSGMSRRSQLSKHKKPTKRFNEDLDAMSIRSRPAQPPAKPVAREFVPEEPKRAPVERADPPARPDNEFARDADEPAEEETKSEPLNEEEAKQRDEQELHDEIDSLYYGSYNESRRSGKSRRSNMTSATYISKLEKELQEERRAREKLAQELEEIKKISSEISSHLGLKTSADIKH